MKYYFPTIKSKTPYLQTNRSNIVGSLWSTFNLDFQDNLGAMRLSQKLVTNTTSSDNANLGNPSAFEFWNGTWWAICNTTIFKNSSNNADITVGFTIDTGGYSVGSSTTTFTVTNTSGTTFRYTYTGTGTDPGITTLTFPIGSTAIITGTGLAAGNRGTFTVTGSGADYFEVTNASGVAESNKTIGSGTITITGGSTSFGYDFRESDLCSFNNMLWATSGGITPALFSRAGTIWTKITTMGAIQLHKLCYFVTFNRLYYSGGNFSQPTILSVDINNNIASPGDDYAISLDNTLGTITTMVANSSYIWIGFNQTENATVTENSQGSICSWDGFSSQITNRYVLSTAGVLSMVVLEDIPYAIDTEGRILEYTGHSFEEIGRLPINRILLLGATESTEGLATGKFVHFNGMAATKNNTLLVNIRNTNEDIASNHSENLQSGIWEFDLDTNSFTHKHSFTLKSLASSTITDYGQNIISSPGAIKLNTFAIGSTGGRGTILAGATYFTDATTQKSAIFIDSPAMPTTDNEGQKRGYFVTTFFNSEEVQDKWTRLWTTFRRFLNATDTIIYKYRLNEEDPIETAITWTSTTTFTTTTNVTAYAPTVSPFNGTIGGEVEVLQGTGSGSCTHISNIVNNAGTYTITLDTAVIGVTGTAIARFQKWIKMFPVITGQVNSYAQIPIGGSNVRIQIKGVLEWTGDDEFYKFILVSNEDIKSNL